MQKEISQQVDKWTCRDTKIKTYNAWDLISPVGFGQLNGNGLPKFNSLQQSFTYSMSANI